MNPVIYGINHQLGLQEKYKDEIGKKSAELAALSNDRVSFISKVTYIDPKDNTNDVSFWDGLYKSNQDLYKTIEKITIKIEEFKGKTKVSALIGDLSKALIAGKELEQLKEQRLKKYFDVAKKELKEEMTIFAAIGRIQNAFVRAIARIAYFFGGPILDAFLDWKGGRVVSDPAIKQRAETILGKETAEKAAEKAAGEELLEAREKAEAKRALGNAAKEAAAKAAEKLEKAEAEAVVLAVKIEEVAQKAKERKKAKAERLEAQELRKQAAQNARANAYGR